jgi:hypothetical protein
MELQFRRYRTLISTLIALWFAGAIIASALLVFKDGRIPAGFGALAPVLAFGIWASASPRFRQFLLTSDLRTLTFLQAWRVAGFVFVVAGAYRILPSAFAFPAGYGDLFIGLTAPFAANFLTKPERRRALIAWQFLGVLDLLMAVTLGVFAPPRVHLIGGALTTAPLTVLPLSMVPTFAVPLVMILHITCIAKLVIREHTSHGTVIGAAGQYSA